ncbi:hypothetical protein EJB05_37533, partial [Eragrostis curvula]
DQSASVARRSISNISTAALVLLLGLICLTTVVRGREWIVGDDRGWGLHINGTWPGGLPIRAGDILVFKYNPNEHDVVEVDEASYNSCHASSLMTLNFTKLCMTFCQSFFICTMPGHCKNGMKVAVTTQA